MQGEFKAQNRQKSKIEWKKEKVNIKGYLGMPSSYNEIAKRAVKAHEDLLDERRRGNTAGSIQRAEESVKSYVKLARSHEKAMIEKGHLTEADRRKGQWHHKSQWWNPFGKGTIYNPKGVIGSPPLHFRGGKKKRKTKRKKRKKRNKTRKHKRRKKRKTRRK